jgi:hypothetical protein
MGRSDEREQIRSEVEAILQEYGVTPSIASHLSPADALRLRDIARRVINGDMDREELSSLSEGLAAELSVTVQRLMALKSAGTIRELEELNPYYTIFQPVVVRDSLREEE